MANLTTNKKVFSVDRSFFLKKSYLIAAYILTSIGNKVVLKVKFIIIAALEYCHSYAAELCGSLRIYKLLYTTVPSEIRGKVNVSFSTDFQAIINALYYIYSLVSFNTHLQ